MSFFIDLNKRSNLKSLRLQSGSLLGGDRENNRDRNDSILSYLTVVESNKRHKHCPYFAHIFAATFVQ